jgi:DNA helicase HerA-like ATPase
VHVVTESDLRTVYAPGDEDGYVSVGCLASAEAIPAYLNLNRLVGRHSIVVGSTGAGKSTAVASLLSTIADSGKLPGARVVLLDLHGEYSRALADTATVFRLSPRAGSEEKQLCIPYWALAFDELASVCFGAMDDKQRSVIADLVVTLKQEALSKNGGISFPREDVSPDSPLPFRLKDLWYRQHIREHRMIIKKQGGSDDDVDDAFVLDATGKPEQSGDAERLIPPKYRTYKTTGPKNEHVTSANEGSSLRQQIGLLHSRLRDKQLGFLFSPGPWSPDADGKVTADLDSLLAHWLGSPRPVTVLDLSGVPSSVLDHLVGAVLRVLFDAAFWGRALPVGARTRPILVVLEEAHRYLGRIEKDSPVGRGGASSAARRIAKEGRKYGVGLMLISQRPAEVDTTILSQCGTIVALRLTNEADRGITASISSDSLKGLFSILPILRTHEALIVGEAVNIPIRARIALPRKGRWPDSEDPMVVVSRGPDGKRTRPGGWTEKPADENYKPLVDSWRRQDPHPPSTAVNPPAACRPANKRK